MPNITHILRAEIDLSQPVPEICGVIAHVLQAWPGREREVLSKLREAIDDYLKVLEKGEGERGKPLRESGRGK
jgi:hypothetical protein